MAHSDVQKYVRKLQDAIGPNIEPCFLTATELMNVHFPASNAPRFLDDVAVDIRELVMACIPDGATRTFNSVVHVSAQ